MDTAEKAEALAKIALFANLNADGVKRLANVATERSFDAGADIVKEGEGGIAMFVIVSGNVEAVKKDNGNEVHLADMGAGSFFGEMALFENFPRSATIRAKSAVTCLALTEWEVQAELRTSPEIAVAMLKVFARRIRAVDEELAALKGDAANVTA